MKPADEEIRAFVAAQPHRATYSEIAAALRGRFGARAWSAEEIRRHCIMQRRAVGYQGTLANNPAMATFIRDRMDRLKMSEIVDACEAAFPGCRIPSRSAVHRFIQAERERALSEGKPHHG